MSNYESRDFSAHGPSWGHIYPSKMGISLGRLEETPCKFPNLIGGGFFLPPVFSVALILTSLQSHENI